MDDGVDVAAVLAPHLADGVAHSLSRQELGKFLPRETMRGGVDGGELLVEVFLAGGYFGGLVCPIVGGPALDHVGDEYLVPRHADGV